MHVSEQLTNCRFNINVTPYDGAKRNLDEDNAVVVLPLDVMNNYFSLGADAHVAVEFHESRGKLVVTSSSPKTFQFFFTLPLPTFHASSRVVT